MEDLKQARTTLQRLLGNEAAAAAAATRKKEELMQLQNDHMRNAEALQAGIRYLDAILGPASTEHKVRIVETAAEHPRDCTCKTCEISREEES